MKAILQSRCSRGVLRLRVWTAALRDSSWPRPDIQILATALCTQLDSFDLWNHRPTLVKHLLISIRALWQQLVDAGYTPPNFEDEN